MAFLYDYIHEELPEIEGTLLWGEQNLQAATSQLLGRMVTHK